MYGITSPKLSWRGVFDEAISPRVHGIASACACPHADRFTGVDSGKASPIQISGNIHIVIVDQAATLQRYLRSVKVNSVFPPERRSEVRPGRHSLADALTITRMSLAVQRQIEDKPLKRVIYAPNRILNRVV